jgi:hypothetical protein
MGLKNALYDKEQSTYIYLKRENHKAKGSTSVESYYFGLFELNVTRAVFEARSFSMDCSFTAKGDSAYKAALGMDYSLSGSFSVSKKELGIASVD